MVEGQKGAVDTQRAEGGHPFLSPFPPCFVQEPPAHPAADEGSLQEPGSEAGTSFTEEDEAELCDFFLSEGHGSGTTVGTSGLKAQ